MKQVERFRIQVREFERINERINKIECCSKITVQQCHAITAIGSFSEPIQSSVLAHTLCIDKSTASRTIDGLVKKDFVERKIPPSNRRQTLISLTKVGEEFYEQIREGCNTKYDSALQQMNPEDRDAFINLFQIFVNTLKQHEQNEQ